jgi:hypothetical protein
MGWLAWLMEIGEMASLFLEICVLKISEAWLAWMMDINEMASLCLSVENKGALASLVDES